MSIKSPFKFLDAYTAADESVYFGRDQEREQLYDLVNQNRLVLVYGPSGSGKTSLIQCGLFNRLDPTDWLPISIRRKENLPKDMYQAVANWARRFRALGKDEDMDLIPLIERLNQFSLRPIYLIFDQFEELLISGTKTEKEAFVAKIWDIYHKCKVPTHILLVMREEYLGGLFEFEEKIPTLFDARLRVERMSQETLKEVILESCRKFDITLQDPEKNTKHIIKVVSGRNAIYQLPYLQVYMDMLYREDWVRTYPDFKGNTLPTPLWPLEFTNQEIEEFGEFENVLGKYLEEQKGILLNRIAEEQSSWSNLESTELQPFTESHLGQALDQLVTPVGTKKIVRFTSKADSTAPRGYYLEVMEDAPHTLRVLPPALRTSLIKALESTRLLRLLDEGVLELAHDSLANIIYKARDEEQQMRNQAYHTIEKAEKDFEKTGEYLSRKQLNFVEDFIPHITLSSVQLAFVRDSYNEAECREQEEANRLQKELDDQRHINESQKQRNRIVLAGLVISILLGGLAAYNWRDSRENEKLAEEKQKLAEVNLVEAKLATLGLYSRDLEEARKIADDFMKDADFQNAAKELERGQMRLDSLILWVEETKIDLGAQIQKLDQNEITRFAHQADSVLIVYEDYNFQEQLDLTYQNSGVMGEYQVLLEDGASAYEASKFQVAYKKYSKALKLWKQVKADEKNSLALNGLEKTKLRLKPMIREKLRLAEKFISQGGEPGKKYGRQYLSDAQKIMKLVAPTREEKIQYDALASRLIP